MTPSGVIEFAPQRRSLPIHLRAIHSAPSLRRSMVMPMSRLCRWNCRIVCVVRESSWCGRHNYSCSRKASSGSVGR
jgi:hypothetical protein